MTERERERKTTTVTCECGESRELGDRRREGERGGELWERGGKRGERVSE